MADDSALPKIAPLTLWYFRRVAKRYFRKHFRSVMVQRLHLLRQARGPLIVYGNHSSWWDPLLMVLLARVALPGRRHYAPMDAEALKRYPIFRRLGVFPVEMATARGAAMFLRKSTAVLRSGGVLWLTPQGRFADPRERPLQFKTGIGLLATRLPETPLLPMAVEPLADSQPWVLPMAVEYTFWDERLPETLMRFGEPVRVSGEASVAEVTAQLERALETEMEALKASSTLRDARAFEAVLRGGRGTGGMYALVRRVRALFGARVQKDHTLRPE